MTARRAARISEKVDAAERLGLGARPGFTPWADGLGELSDSATENQITAKLENH